MDTRRSFIKKASILGGSASFLRILPESIQKALSIDPAAGSTFWDAEHVVLLMQENRSFDHTFGTLQGVRGYNDPRTIELPNRNKVWLQSNKEGQTFAPFRLDMKGTKATWMNSLPHSWSNQVDARNQGKMDGWLDAKHSGHEEYKAMPLTMGYYTREDIPFYYSLADAFTVCDQHFCSSLTGTTPNRLYFWTGTIRERAEAAARANVWNEDTDYEAWGSWTTFPERLEEQGVSWKIYQNELSVGVGFEGEEDAWLANFTDNPIEFFRQFHVKFSPEYIANLPHAAEWLKTEIKKQEDLLPTIPSDSKKVIELNHYISELKKYREINARDQLNYTLEKYEALSTREKSIHQKAFSTNRGDPAYHQLTTLKYQDGNEQREMLVPKGDILHQFREDVKNGQLPAVSWLVAPENFSDHPGAAWFGAWYISEALDILTQNPDVWKKTIFILTYDENDGYFDHVPPFVAPDPYQPGSGKASEGIPTDIEYVRKQEQSIADYARESSIGLGYRVPMVVASPWSRGGWVCSEVFDHTSPIQFLEKFLSRKTNKKIAEPNISDWRRTICGDLSSVFRTWNGEKINLPAFIERDPFLESIHKAKFKNVPTDYKALTPEEINVANTNPHQSPYMPVQEKGTRSSCALPYELYADGQLSADKKTFEIILRAANKIFGEYAAGAPFQIYVPGKYMQEMVRTWSYGVKAGDELKDQWPLADFENNAYHLRVYGPNGFYREFIGDAQDPVLDVLCHCQFQAGQKPTGNIEVSITNGDTHAFSIEVIDHAYHTATRKANVPPGKIPSKILVETSMSHGWYDFSVKVSGLAGFEKRFAGRVETGIPGKTDPFMGGVVA